MCFMCGRRKRNHCSPGCQASCLRMRQLQEKRRREGKKKILAPRQKRSTCQTDTQSFLQPWEAIVLKPQEQIMAAWRAVSCQRKWHRSAHGDARGLICVSVTQDGFEAPRCAFNLPLREEERRTWGSERDPGCQAPSGRDEKHTRNWRLMASLHVPARPLSTNQKL